MRGVDWFGFEQGFGNLGYSGVGLKGEEVHYVEMCRVAFIHFLIAQK